MPVVYKCRRCGHVLYEFLRVGQDSYGLPTPSELVAKIGDTCPKCGNRLKASSLDDIKVAPYSRRTRVVRYEADILTRGSLRAPFR